MLRFLTLLFALVASPALSQTIDNLGTGTALTGTELIPMFQSANPAVTTTPSAVGTYLTGRANTWSAANTFSSTLTFSGLTTGTQVSCLGLTAGNAVALATGACGSGGGGTGANPTATAGPTAVNGTATTFLRSDGAPAIQKATSGQFGLVEVDGTSITAASGVISASATGTVTSVGSGCGTSTSGSPITTTGTIISTEPITIRTTGAYVAGDCGTLVQYNSASDQTPTLPTTTVAGAGLFFDTCSINHAQTITATGSNTIGGAATYSMATGTAAAPTCVKLVSNGGSGASGDWKPIPMVGGSGGGTGANPTATAGDTAVNGSATTFLRSDGAPAVQKGSSSLFGIVKVDNTTITASSGVISAVNNGTVTSVAGGCGASTSGSPITATGTISAIETVTVRTSGNYATGDCGTLVNYNDASDATPTLPASATAGAGFYFDTCNINHTQTITRSGSDTIGGATTYLLRTGTAALPTCVKLVADGTATWEVIPVQGATQVFVQPIETSSALSGCNGSTATINLTLGSYFECTVSAGAVTFAVSNPAASGLVSSFTLELTNGGSQTRTWMSGTKWPGGTPPTLTTSGVDLVVCSTRDAGTTWRCVASELNSS